MQKILKWTHKASFPLNQDIVVSGNTINIKAVFLLLSSVITILIPKSMAQLPDNGFRNRDYNDDVYNSGGSFGGSQTILEVVKSINYLSEVRICCQYFWYKLHEIFERKLCTNNIFCSLMLYLFQSKLDIIK